ncbi:MAG: rod shape-determining protein MreD [Candidatus Eisenbacteria bacterium]|nr:rod shape-determining protein MreD [Candidatus Eisenbacteria bacterium]
MRSVGGLVLFAAVIMLLRSTALSAFAARDIVVDALAFATVFWALRYGAAAGATFGFLLGLAADLDATHWLGRHALILALGGWLIGWLARRVVRESLGTQLVLIAIATAAPQLWIVPFELGGTGGLAAGWLYLAQRVLIAVLVTAPLGVVVLVIARQLIGRPIFAHALGQPG